ncbi:MAG TPA: Crp/Fnr family transcriptional regulator [Caulobacteraceae bacterium]|jgi:CRP-like cAMP-binding protein|nr:Crp/Fnr family transcriptional regulator [Caulobacteraceae bacterium]
MSGQDKIEMTPSFLEQTPASLRRVIESRMRTVRASKGRTIIGVGSRSTEVFHLIEGEAQVLLYSNNGREVSVRNLGPGAIFGELAALLDGPRSATVVALTDLRVQVMSRDDFLSCIEGSPAAALWLARRLAAEVRRLTERVFELSALNVQARLHCELLRLARGSAPYAKQLSPAPTHAELANRIGTHREAVTREMRALAEMNIIRNHRRSLEFLDVPELERVVCRAVGDLDEASQLAH